MRWTIAIAAALVVAGCGKELNPEFCQVHPNDPDCRNAGLTSIDAPPPCRGPLDCAGIPGRTVCDLQYGECVECTANDNQCPQSQHICGRDDQCHGCVTDSDCPGQVCITSTGLCTTASDTVLYAAPPPTGSAMAACTPMAKCTLDTALMKAGQTSRAIIALDPGMYTGPSFTMPANNVTVQGPSTALGQTPTAKLQSTMDNQPVVKVPANATAELDNLILDSAKNGDGIDCTNATLVLHHVFVTSNDKQGVHADGCTLTLDHSFVNGNMQTGVFANNATVTIYDNFISQNGGGFDFGGMRLQGVIGGDIRFNTIAYNTAKTGSGIAGISCNLTTASTVALLDDLLVENTINNGSANLGGNCPPSFTLVTASNDSAKFQNPPGDLHLTDCTKKPDILNNADVSTECGPGHLVVDDYDGQVRPIDGHCDVGADEHPDGMSCD